MTDRAAINLKPSDGAPSHPGSSPVACRRFAALAVVRQRQEHRKIPPDRFADRATGFAGNMWCGFARARSFGGWFVVDTGHPSGFRPFDPFPLVMPAMITSFESIFLSTSILISQNRSLRLDEQRSKLNLQISPLAEHELTRASRRLDDTVIPPGLPDLIDADFQDVKRDVRPEIVVDEINRAEQTHRPGQRDS